MNCFKLRSNDSGVKFALECDAMVTHTNFESKRSVFVHWKAPPRNSGCIAFKYLPEFLI